MSTYQNLYYKGNIEKIEEELKNIYDPTIQEMHNLCISQYILHGVSPLPILIKILKGIETEKNINDGSWVSHPSYSLLKYHLCLFYFMSSDFSNCFLILEQLFNNFLLLNDIIQLMICILTIEIYIRYKNDFYLKESLIFIEKNYNNLENLTQFLIKNEFDDLSIKNIRQIIEYKDIRIKIHSLIHQNPTEEIKNELEKELSKFSISPDLKTRQILSVSLSLSLSSGFLYLNDKLKYQNVLDSTEDPFHFAILNNRGIFELINQRYSSSLLHFSKSINSRYNNDLVYPFHQVAYNLGLSLLMKKKPLKAFQYFHSIIPLMSQSPYLWLRLSESIIMFYKQRILKLRKRNQYSSILSKKLTTNSRTFYLLPLNDNKIFEKDIKKIKDLNLEFAEKSTRNCIHLCNNNLNLLNIKKSAELISSFIWLELNDGKKSLEMCKEFQKDSLNKQSLDLSKIYLIQSHFISGDFQEAEKILNYFSVERDLSNQKDRQNVFSFTFFKTLIALGLNKKAEEKLLKDESNNLMGSEIILTKIEYEINRKNYKAAINLINSYKDL